MGQKLVRIVHEDDGMSTAEYAVGTVAAAGFGGLLLKLLTSPDVQHLLWSVVTRAFSWIGGSRAAAGVGPFAPASAATERW